MKKGTHIPTHAHAGRTPAHAARALQLKPAAPHTPQGRPPAPPVYAPNPQPKVLQRKSSLPTPTPTPNPNPSRPVSAPAAKSTPASAPARRPPPVPHVSQRMAAAPARPNGRAHGAAVQPLAAKVVQATKLYPNLHPGAVERVEENSVFKLSSFADQYRLRKTQSHGVYVPNQLYNFVRTSEGEMLLHNRYRHPSIAEGRQVLYAGEAYFNNGKLEWWSNGSGHYQPDSDDAQQAALPMEQFYSYQQVIKGEHKRRQK